MKDLAKELKDMESLLFMGRGYNYATALEAALKVSCQSTIGRACMGCAKGSTANGLQS